MKVRAVKKEEKNFETSNERNTLGRVRASPGVTV